MYSGTTFQHHSGNLVGVHQRIDRVAKKHLVHHIGREPFFPTIKTILHFEGKNGPDGIKSKSPSVDEPWHFISPNAAADDPLVKVIEDHLYNLSVALKNEDEVRAGFEAAWLSHAIVDGLTPAHHVPLAEKIEELWGKAHHERSSKSDKIIIKGRGARDSLAKNWEYWGTKGVFSAHLFYEMGVASSLTVATFSDIGITDKDLARIRRQGYVPYFMESIKEIDAMGTYQEFVKTGWSVRLGNISRKQLIPLIMKNVCLAWYAAQKGKVS
ncbi:MAG: hypothetical protein WAQ27_06210 [Candidatus Microsaccharimonas sp.]